MIRASSVTLADCAFRKADPTIVRLFCGLFRPKNVLLGDDVSGVVEAVGRGVTRFKPGEAVYGSAGGRGHAEYVCVSEDAAIVAKPATIDDGQAAGLSYSFLTAMPFIRDEGKVKPGDRVLINGAAGSVGAICCAAGPPLRRRSDRGLQRPARGAGARSGSADRHRPHDAGFHAGPGGLRRDLRCGREVQLLTLPQARCARAASTSPPCRRGRSCGRC